MHKLNKISENISSESRREFLTYSSIAMLGMATCSILPTPVLAAVTPITTSLQHLDSLSLYVSSSNAVPGQAIQNFSEPVDEARYLSQILFQELMKYEFQYNHYTIASQLGLLPNSTMMGWNNVSHIYNLHRDYFTNHMAEYISAMLQSANRTNTSLSVNQRIPSNTWDMAKANQSIDVLEKGSEYRVITDKLYAACLPYCKSESAYALGGYIYPDARWAHELKNYYESNVILEQLIDELRAEDDNLVRFTNAQRKIDGIINKISILNRASSYGHISESDLEKLEQRMFGVVFSGVALSMRWGGTNERDSVLARTSSYDEVVTYLRNAQSNGSQETSTFWNSFFSTTSSPTKFWADLAGMGLTNLSLRDSIAKQRITTKYPDLGTSKGTIFLNSFLLLLGISHFSWATANDDDEFSNPVRLTELGVTFAETGVNVLYDALVTKVAWKMIGNSNATSAGYFSKFSQFINKLRGTGNVFSNKARLRAEKIFKASNIGNIIGKVAIALAAIGAVVAVWTLATAIAEGDTAGIVFGSLNLIVSVLGVMAMALAWAAPVAIAIAIVGLLLFIAEWLYNLFKPTPPPPNPYRDFTESVMRPAQLVLGAVGSFLCRTNWGNGTKVSPFDITNMNYDFMNQPNIDAVPYSELKAVITSRKSKFNTIYNFSDLRTARKGAVVDFFKTGVATVIPGWSLNGRFRGRCTHVAESYSWAGSKAIFAAVVDYDYNKPTLHVTDGLERAPTIEGIINGIDYNTETIVDIVGIHDLSIPTFIIFTTKHIYQYTEDPSYLNGYGTLIKVCDGYNLNAAGSIFNLTAFASSSYTKQSVFIYLQSNLDQNSNIYCFVLSQNSGGIFNKLEHVRTMSTIIIPGNAQGINALNGFAGVHIADQNSPRTYTLGCGRDTISRFGMMRTDESSTAQHTCYNDVAFKLSNNVFQGFYKNAYIVA